MTQELTPDDHRQYREFTKRMLEMLAAKVKFVDRELEPITWDVVAGITQHILN